VVNLSTDQWLQVSIPAKGCFVPDGLETTFPWESRPMPSRQYIIATMVAAQICCIASAGGSIFSKPQKAKPARERVPELVAVIKTNPDESLRADAAEELRQFDPVQFPEIIPALIDALLTDKKPSVRAESALSLGKLKGIHSKVGLALEQSMVNDTSMRVRLQARSSLFTYQLAGYRSPIKPTNQSQTTEPAITGIPSSTLEVIRAPGLSSTKPQLVPAISQSGTEKPVLEKQTKTVVPTLTSWFRKTEKTDTAQPVRKDRNKSDDSDQGPDLGTPR
jgi:hypothetical protein